MKAKNKRLFSNTIIVYCIAYMSVYLWRCLDIITTTDVNPSNCVTVAGAFFGGELLVVCLAYVFGGDKVKAAKQQAQDQVTEETTDTDAECTI